MCKQSAPKPPDYAAAAREQGVANKDAAIATSVLSNPNFTNPYGFRKVNYSTPTASVGVGGWSVGADGQPVYSAGSGAQTGVDGVPTVNIEEGFSPELQKQFDSQNRIINELNSQAEKGLGRVGDQMATTFPGSETFQKAGSIDTGALRPQSDLNTNGLQDVGRLDTSGLSPQGSFDTSALRDYQPASLDNLPEYLGLKVGDLSARGNLTNEGMQGMTPLDLQKLTGRTVAPSVGGLESVTNAIRQRAAPGFAQERSATEADLMARGFNPGGSGYDSRINSLDQKQNDFDLAALLAGGQEQSRIAGLESQVRGQDLGEQQANLNAQMGIRNQEFGERGTLANYADKQRATQFDENKARSDQRMKIRQAMLGERTDQEGRAAAQRAQQFGEQGVLASYADQQRATQLAEQQAGLSQDERNRQTQFNERGQVAQFDAGQRSQQLQEQQAQTRADADLRARQIQEEAYFRGIPLSELNALRTGGMPTAPQFQAYSGATVAPPPVFDAANSQYNAALNQYQANGPGLLSTLAGGALGAAGAAGGFRPLFGFENKASKG